MSSRSSCGVNETPDTTEELSDSIALQHSTRGGEHGHGHGPVHQFIVRSVLAADRVVEGKPHAILS